MTDPTQRQVDGVVQAVGDVLVAGMNRDAERVATIVCDVAERYGDAGLYSMCCGLANAVEQVAFPPPRGFAELDMLDGRAPEEQDDQAALWAARFLTASLNGDAKMKTALFYAAEGEQAAANIIAFVALAAGTIRDVRSRS
jgi:hypothetical protein